MNCKECKELLNNYLSGHLDPSVERSTQNHLDNCPSCQNILDSLIAENDSDVAKPPKPVTANLLSPVLEEKKQEHILRKAKHKHRIVTALSVIVIIFLFQIAGTLVSSLIYYVGGEDSRLYRAQKTALLITEFNMPNVTIPIGVNSWPSFFSQIGWGHSNLEIKPYLAARGSYTLEKTIGKKTYPVGTLNLDYFLLTLGTKLNWENGAYHDTLFFVHPEMVKNIPEQLADRTTESWDALDILPEGTVAEMAVSFDKTYTLSEIDSLLKGYDLDITWFAVSTGVEGDDPYSDRHHPVLSAFSGAWGFADMSFMLRSQHNSINLDNIYPLQETFFMDSMVYLVKNEKIAREIYRGPRQELQLQERLNHLQKNGVKVYGVVVTGPSKELLKLKELDAIRYPVLGEVELWNWYNPSFGGNMY